MEADDLDALSIISSVEITAFIDTGTSFRFAKTKTSQILFIEWISFLSKVITKSYKRISIGNKKTTFYRDFNTELRIAMK
jgi:hypothetical protein